jgi:hypothetical protein
MVVPSESIGALVQTFMAMRMQMIGGPSRIEDHAPSDDFEEGDFEDGEDNEGREKD